MKKRSIRILICLLLLALILPCFTACHKHKLVVEWTKDENQHYHLCECGEKMDVGDHEWVQTRVIKQVNCVEAGIVEQTCNVCGMVRQVANEAYDHDWQDGYDLSTHFKYCVGCGEKIDQMSHSLILTRTNDHHIRHCKFCDYVQLKEEHDYDLITGICSYADCSKSKGETLLPSIK